MTERRPPDGPAARGEPRGRSNEGEGTRGAEREELQARLEAVWERYGGVVEERVRALEGFVAKAQAGAATPADVHAAHELAHMLTGSLAMFGFPDGSEVARGAQELLAERDEIADPDLSALSVSIAALRAAVSLPRNPRQA